MALTRVAFLFPGQGSQQPAMGEELLEDPAIRSLCQACGDASGLDLVRLLTTADEDELRQTENAQPALCFVGVALAGILMRAGVEPVGMAGHSVGEYSALCAAGAMSAMEAVRVVAERGRAMSALAPSGSTGMAAVLGLTATKMEALLRDTDGVWAANYNTPGQTVIAGRREVLDALASRLRAAGAKRIVSLNVSAAFHTPLMKPAGQRLRASLDTVSWKPPRVPVISNVTGRPYGEGDQPSVLLERQLSSPVRWSQCVGRLRELGCETFLELGPRRALTGMMRELAPNLQAVALGSPSACVELELSAK